MNGEGEAEGEGGSNSDGKPQILSHPAAFLYLFSFLTCTRNFTLAQVQGDPLHDGRLRGTEDLNPIPSEASCFSLLLDTACNFLAWLH